MMFSGALPVYCEWEGNEGHIFYEGSYRLHFGTLHLWVVLNWQFFDRFRERRVPV